MQSRAGELTNETMVVDIEEIEGTTLEERLIAMRRVLCVLENHVEENYEKFKRTSKSFKIRLAALERYCRDVLS
ncbi:unnamed protein product [Heligmosomoides polygyrus]|uniref:HSCB_C domain-containing protein n=1 Tax=Heligmosomoides polygyrus TaxID=6339 RepID=A0A183GT71_HELPZ|nr:unnamed protein product [Heligmosomoides polygyrus]